jgi:UDP-N-acetylmuramate--alanine ligase
VTDLNNIKQVYFLGIGGIGMSALARYFMATGKLVAGYDRTPTDLTLQLENEGISVHYEDSAELIPPAFRSSARTLVVFTPAVPEDHMELAYFKTHAFEICKRSEILGHITRNKKTLAVAGTHGKTTVSTMIAYLMTKAGTGCSAFLGGISRNFGSNLVLDSQSDWVVAEADEFDRSFLRLFPWAAVITAMDPDHLDIFGNALEMNEAFNLFAGQINPSGILLMKYGLPLRPSSMPGNVYTYSLGDEGDFHAENIHLLDRQYHFDLKGPGTEIKDISLMHSGLVNVENAVAACALSALLGLAPEKIRHAMQNFSGIQRRFEYHILTGKMVYIDDYAHHPKEIEATLLSLRDLYPGKKLTGVFQPHLFTRTRDFAEGFAHSLGLLDELILLDIYPAREMPIAGVNAEMILNKVKLKDKIICSKEQLLGELKKRSPEVLITLGAGDIDKLVEPITNLFTREMNP